DRDPPRPGGVPPASALPGRRVAIHHHGFSSFSPLPGTSHCTRLPDDGWRIASTGSGPMNFYDIDLVTIDGKRRKMDAYRGRTLLIVNVASQCGFTRQYAGLQALYDRFKDRD